MAKDYKNVDKDQKGEAKDQGSPDEKVFASSSAARMSETYSNLSE